MSTTLPTAIIRLGDFPNPLDHVLNFNLPEDAQPGDHFSVSVFQEHGERKLRIVSDSTAYLNEVTNRIHRSVLSHLISSLSPIQRGLYAMEVALLRGTHEEDSIDDLSSVSTAQQAYDTITNYKDKGKEVASV